MEKGDNLTTIALKLEIYNVVRRYAGSAQQSNGYWLMEQALQGSLTPEFWISEFEKDFPTKGKEIYDQMVQWYKKTNIQQRMENELEKQKKEIRDKAKEDIKKLEPFAEFHGKIAEDGRILIDNDYVEKFKQKYPTEHEQILKGQTYTTFKLKEDLKNVN